MKQQDISKEVWNHNYRAPKEKTLRDTWERQARAAVSVEKPENQERLYQDFMWLLTDFRGIAGGRITANLGVPEREGTTLMNCISGDTLVQTKYGPKQAKDLKGFYDVRCIDGKWRPAEWKSFGQQKLYIVKFSDGFEVRATAGHEWYVNSPKGLKVKTTTQLLNTHIPIIGESEFKIQNTSTYIEGVRHGAVYGDGHYCNTNHYCIINLFGNKKQLVNKFFPEATYHQCRDKYEARHLPKHYKSIPTETDMDYIRGFLAGLMATDGHVDKRGACYFTSSNKDSLDNIRHLFAMTGSPCGPTRVIRKKSNYGDYSPNYGFNIFRRYVDDTILIRDDQLYRFNNNKKSNKINSRKVISIIPDSIETVYCCIEPKTHSWALADGTITKNCYVHNPRDIKYKDPDSINGIYDMLKAQALTLKSEGGYGMNFSWIRPSGMYVRGIGARTPGVIQFMSLWNQSSAVITMGSDKILGDVKENEKKKIRKGAQMGVLEIWHPEIEDFIDAKLIEGRLNKFNLSVGITDGFIDAVKNDKTWQLIFPDTECDQYETEWDGNINDWISKELPVKVYKKLKARDLWNKIMKATYTRNDPGVLFLDIANKFNTIPEQEDIATTNPCGEVIMPTGVCLLTSLNLVKYVIRDEHGNSFFDYENFRKAIRIATRFADNINDISRVPLDEYKDAMLNKRRIGLGVLGLGSLHYMLGIRFGSNTSLELINDIFKCKAETEILASAELGKEKGSFPLFNKDAYFNTYWWKNLPISDSVKAKVESIGCMRNSHRSANAPTGNMSIYAGVVSGGIEPVFMKEYTRWAIVPESDRSKLKTQGLTIPDALNGEWFETDVFKKSKRGTDHILKGTFNNIDYEIDKNRGLTKASQVVDYGWLYVKEHFNENEIKEMESNNIFATTTDLSVDDHINTLSIVAKYTDMSSSKTINIPNDYPYEKFKDIYLKSWDLGIKGITTYRDGTMTAVLEKKQEIVEKRETLENIFTNAKDDVILDDVKLPDEYYSKGVVIRDNNRKKWYVTIAFADSAMSRPFALFVNTNSKESNEVAEETIHAMMKLAKTVGIKNHLIDDQLDKYQGQSNVTKIARSIGLLLRHNVQIINIVDVLDEGNYPLSSFTFHIKRLLKQYIKDGTEVKGKNHKCPKCGGAMIFNEGCILCRDCGWARCG